MKILIATTNEGKFKEMVHFLNDLPFDFISLKDLDIDIEEPEEDKPDIEGNAILKARYYAEKTGLVSISDDGGLFIDALDGWPGVKSARVADSVEDRIDVTLEKMKDIPEDKRTANFQSCLAVYNPKDKNIFIAHGQTDGKILNKKVEAKNGFGYDPIFYVNEAEKTYAEMTTSEKNSISHRGKAVNKIKYFLQNQYNGKHVVVPFAIIIKEGKILLALRNEPHRPEYHKKWELPGGTMEVGETLVGNVEREAKEEAGYDVEVVEQINYIGVESQQGGNLTYQVYLIPFVCKIIGGDGIYSDAEILDTKWVEVDDVLNHEMIGNNNKMFKEFLPELKRIIKENNL